MRHGVKKVKLQRDASHRKALLANQACSLIDHGRITTTLAKAKALRPYVEKLITLGKDGSLHARRRALAILPKPSSVKKLFGAVATATAERNGGYTRIVKLGQRKTDSAPMALIEIIDLPTVTEEVTPAPATTPAVTTEQPTSAETPADAPAEAPAETSTETPTEEAAPAEAPTEEAPTEETPAETPAEATAEAATETPVAVSAETPSEAPSAPATEETSEEKA